MVVQKHGVLFYSWIDRIDHKLVLVVPKTLQEKVLYFCNDTITARHLGLDKTLLIAKHLFSWYVMSRDAKLYVNSCRVCSMNKKPNMKPKANPKLYHAGFPMERVHVDLLGPFVVSSQGNKYILMMIDQFNKWSECAPVPDWNAKTVAQNFLPHFVVSFGCPLEVHNDQGKQSDGNLFKAFYHLLQKTKTQTTPYHPASNGQVECYNHLVLQMIHCFIGKHAQDLHKYLPLLVMVTHAMGHKETGFTPNQLMLGREVMMPFDLIMDMVDV